MIDEQGRYIDPNSGAAPQPGGLGTGPVLNQEEPEQAADNVTEPGDARELSEDELNDPTAGVEEVPEEQLQGAAHDTEVQNQAAPLGDQPGDEPGEDDEPSEDNEPGEGDEGDEGGEEEAQDEEPAGNASRDEWVDFAKTKGASDEELEDLKRDDLRDLYGS